VKGGKIVGTERDFSEFDAMTKEELQNYINRDFLLSQEESDIEAVLYVMGLLEKMEKVPDAADSMETFNNIYRPTKNDDEPIFGEERITKIRKAHRSFMRKIAAIAAVLILVIITGTVKASPEIPWSSTATWDEDVFYLNLSKGSVGWKRLTKDWNFTVNVPDGEFGIEKFCEYATNYGIPESQIPTYIPENYKLGYVSLESKVSYFSANASRKSDKTISIKYVVNNADKEIRYKYNSEVMEPQIFENGGNTYYIMANWSNYFAVWTFDNVSCIIQGMENYDDVIDILCSING
jgi:hypothetical protein